MTTCNSYDEKFFETFQQSLQQQNPNLPPSLRSVHAVQAALQECESLFSSPQKQNEIPEVFSVRRSDNISDAFSFPSASEWVSEYISGMKPVRVVGFVQELDTETSLLDSSPKHFARNIVLNGQVEQEDSSNGATTEDGNDGNQSQQQQQVFTECTSLFITPIPGFKYHHNVEEENSQHLNNREEQQKSSSTKKRNLQPNSPLIDKKRSRVEIDEKNSNNQNQSNIETSNTKKARPEDEDDDRENEENNQHGNSKTKQSSNAATTTSILSYGDEDLIRKNEKENIESRKLWKDVLGLSLAPTHENLATGVVGLIPHASNENFSPPALFGLVEVFGFLIPPSSDSQNEENLENNNNNLNAYDDFDLLSSSRFHTMPETVCPRLLILKWNRLESVEEAHEKISKIKNNNNDEQQEATFQSLISFIQNKIFSNVGSSNTSANAVSKALLIHLVTSVIIRNESGAFGDLPLSIEVIESEEENHDADSSFNSFVSRISSLVQSLRPCSMTCEVEYGLLLSSRININISNHQNHTLQLTHPSSVIARLDYEKQAVSSCLFSLPHGAEMVLAVDDISHHHNHQNRHRQERKSSNGVQQSVFFNQNKNNGSEKIISTPLLQEQQQLEQKAIANYSRNINVLADLLIQQKLPILFGPRCEVSIERDLGILFLVRTAKDTKMSNNNNNNNLKNKKSDQRLSEDSSNVADAENNFLPYFGTDDIFIPLKFRLRRHNQQNNNGNEASPQEIESLIKNNKFEEYFSNSRQRYLSCAGTYQNNNSKNESNNNENSYFENNENGEGDKYFEATFNQLRSSSDNVGWSTAMIKHSMPNVLLTMARARAVLGGRRLVRKSDIDEAKEILIELRRS